MSMYNERVFNILLESAKGSKTTTKEECGEACSSFQDTIGNGHNFSDVLVPDSVKMNKDTIPVCKVSKSECGAKCGKECGDNCNESAYFIDGRMLDIYMNDNGINDDAQAVFDICEHYNIDVNDVYVVVECDEVNKGLIDHAKKYEDCGLLRRCHDQICNCLNAGIKVAKRS